ncbi:transmembrane protein 47 [Biomphalaria pfeifferi]|uniref:Transmembrane protein 47 n=1 Tax=Biomphalaria pfeifferi TaxID=112525 RepID=A0AAD8BV93_BIOPF|nr:transmembrane protein 47 [Biomphalaria pfeifferi]
MGAEDEDKPKAVVIEKVVIVRPLKVLGLLCGVLAVLLLMISVAATSWLKAEDVLEGLWEKCVYNRSTPDWVECDNSMPREWVTICQALCIISLIVCMAAIAITSVGLKTTNFILKYKMYWIGLIIFFAAAAFELISLVIFPIKFLSEMLTRSEIHWSFGWAYIVGWAGAVCEFTAGLFLLLDKGAEEVIFREKSVQEEKKNGVEGIPDKAFSEETV